MAIFDLNDTNTKARKGFSSPELKQRHARALDGFHASESFFSEQRKREKEDLLFVDFDEQWDPTVKTQRAGNQAVNGLPPTPPRPMITINQLRAPCQQVANQRRAARLGLEFAPKGAGASSDVAEVFEDIVRAAQAESRANIARNWAADRAEKAGLGWYRIETEYCEDSDDPAAFNDQDLVWHRVLNQAAVYPDPHAQEPDFSDGRRAYLTEDLPLEVYRELYPDSDVASFDSSELTGQGNPAPKWIFTSANGTDGDESQTVRIAEVWEVVETERTRILMPDGRAVFEDELKDGEDIPDGALKRKIRDRAVFWSKINGVEYLEEPREINAKYIPLIPCVGMESNVNGERRWTGIVRPGKEAAVSYNVMRSAQVEAIATTAKAPYLAYGRVIGQFMEWWKQSPIRNFPFLPIDEAYDKNGELLPPPARTSPSIDIGAMTVAAAAAKDDVHMTTGVPPVALGQLDPHDRSGRAIQALQGQSEVGSSGYLDNFVSITLAYEGKVIRDLILRVFDRVGRIVPAVGLDEKRRLVMLNAPFIYGPDQKPVMLPGWHEGDPVPPQIPGPDGQPMEVHYINLREGQYSVAPVAGKSYNTRREEASAAIGEVLKVMPPEMAMAIAPAWLEEQDYPAAKKIAEIAKKALPPPLRAAYDDGESKKSDPQIQALEQKVQELTQIIQGKTAEKQAEAQAKGQIDLAKTQLQESAENQRAKLEADTSILKTQITANATLAANQAKVDAENFRSYVDASEERVARLLDMHLQKQSEQMQRLHEHVQNALDRQHEARMAQVQHQQALEQGAQQHQAALEQGQQAADLAPTPESGT